MQAMKHIGRVFKESDSDASAMIVFEGEQPLGDEAHRYYARPDQEAQGRHRARHACAGFLG